MSGKTPVLESLFNKVARLNLEFCQKRGSLLALSFAKFFRASFLRNISVKQLLEEHWILLKTVPIAIANNISKDLSKGTRSLCFSDQLFVDWWISPWNPLAIFFLSLNFFCLLRL